MVDSMHEQLMQDLTCESLLECFHGLKALDRAAFRVLTRCDRPLTVDEIAEAVDRERSTAYRSVQRLREAGLVSKAQVNYQDGGYYHVFEPVDADAAADGMQRMLNDWYTEVGHLIGEFRETYESADERDREREAADTPTASIGSER